MRKQFLFAYALGAALALWSVLAGNYEFLIYSFVALMLVGLLHQGDRKFQFNPLLLWGFNLWLISHILGGLWQVGGSVMYSLVLIDIVGEPYSILKYDQLIHTCCYFIVAGLMWQVVSSIAREGSFTLLAGITVLAASGIGGLNELVEFLATVVVPDTNVGGYENTAIDLVANFVGACLAVPIFRKL